MSKKQYEVIVGNIGTVYDGDDKIKALRHWSTYVSNSKSGFEGVGRCTGESVTLFEDGEPTKDHMGYQYMYENYDIWELECMLSDRRKEDKDHCPVCNAVVKIGDKSYMDHVMTNDDTQHQIRVPCKCPGCGLKWLDLYTKTGIELPRE